MILFFGLAELLLQSAEISSALDGEIKKPDRLLLLERNQLRDHLKKSLRPGIEAWVLCFAGSQVVQQEHRHIALEFSGCDFFVVNLGVAQCRIDEVVFNHSVTRPEAGKLAKLIEVFFFTRERC
jgi:hypothetical protein